jgi:Na+/H+-dicarboxylate symporter
VVGYICHETIPDRKLSADIAAHISIVTDVFLRLIKMIISLLVFSTLAVGIAHMGDAKAAGRVG